MIGKTNYFIYLFIFYSVFFVTLRDPHVLDSIDQAFILQQKVLFI